MTRQQRQGDCNKGGEPESHMDAKSNVLTYLANRGYLCRKEYPVLRPNYRHQYDLVAFGPDPNKTIVEIFKTNDFYDNEKLAKMDIKKYLDTEVKIVVEIGNIGDDTKHNPGHKSQMINDGIAAANAQEIFPEAKFFRLNKDDCLHPKWLQEIFRF